jgi:integrase
MPKRALTAAAVDKLKPPKTGQVDHFDKGYPGLALRISYGGRKCWIYFYRIDGKQRRLTLGVAPAMGLGEAREAWREARKAVEAGQDPARMKAKPDRPDIFEMIAAEWLQREQFGKGRRSANEVRRILERDVVPAWGQRDIRGITRRDARELIDAIADRGAVTMARRVHAHLHALFRWSAGRDMIEANPLADLPKPGRENPRDRFLDDNELAMAWKAAETISWPFGPAVQLLILTGCRREEITRLRWSEIDGDVIRLPAERVKTGPGRTVPLSASARAILDMLPSVERSDYVFTTNGRTPISGWSRAKTLLDRAIAAEAGTNAAGPARSDESDEIAPWRIHDLRRSVATGLQRLGVGLQVIEAVLGHVSGSRAGIVGVYQRHSFEDEKRVALERWGHHVAGLVSGDAAELVAFPRAI